MNWIKKTGGNWKKKADNVWAEIIKVRAGYRSEFSGKEGRQIGGDYILNSHHIVGKPNFTLRYSLENGMCLTSGEHFQLHRNSNYKRKIEKLVSEARWKILDELEGVIHKARYEEKYYELMEIYKSLCGD